MVCLVTYANNMDRPLLVTFLFFCFPINVLTTCLLRLLQSNFNLLQPHTSAELSNSHAANQQVLCKIPSASRFRVGCCYSLFIYLFIYFLIKRNCSIIVSLPNLLIWQHIDILQILMKW